MSHLPRPTSAASTSSSSGIGTLPLASKIPKPGFNTASSAAADPTSKGDDHDGFKLGDRVSNKDFANGKYLYKYINCFHEI